MDKARDFFNPQSMLTPGLAGAMTMTITNTIATQFQLGIPWPAAMALTLSCLFGLLAMKCEGMQLWRKLIYFALNSLVIFTMAVGSNTLGGSLAAQGPQAVAAPVAAVMSYAIPTAYAQTPSGGWCQVHGALYAASQEDCRRANGRFAPDKEELQRTREQVHAPQQVKDPAFFRQWFVGQGEK